MTENDLNISVPFLCRAGHLNSTSAPNISRKRRCENEYTLISRSHSQNTELGTDWQEDMSSRTLFAGVADLFVIIEWPQGYVSSANSNNHLESG